MPWRLPPLPPVPAATAVVVQATFPKGHLDVALRTEVGPLSDQALCAAL
jgi:hypothetical protein